MDKISALIAYLQVAHRAAIDKGDTVLADQLQADIDRLSGRCPSCGEFMGDHGCVTVGCQE